MQASKQTTVLHQELKAAFLQGDESQASELFNERLRIAVRLGLFSAMEEDLNILCGAKHFPIPSPTTNVPGVKLGAL
jgi:hypothetical protein